ncbi:MAG TPA: glycerol-3-phosphate 1-O-acyltransferase PlsY [Steroidobacteraceae bacterium]|nr:glycerol-3-phosphate 1-O-acyltransferase PlsY [Steroidobacteraceae bacterium]
MIDFLIKVALSYALGSVLGGLVIGRLRGGVDIRSMGSGNAGSTNALRTQGRKFALAVLLIDVGKGYVASRLIPLLALPLPVASPFLQPWLAAACSAAALLGHVYPLWYGFRGGKAVATFVGVILGLAPLWLVPVLLVWAAVLICTGFVGLSSIIGATAFPVGLILADLWPRGASEPLPLVVFALFAAGLIILTHRQNIARMLKGNEPRARRVWLRGRRSA